MVVVGEPSQFLLFDLHDLGSGRLHKCGFHPKPGGGASSFMRTAAILPSRLLFGAPDRQPSIAIAFAELNDTALLVAEASIAPPAWPYPSSPPLGDRCQAFPRQAINNVEHAEAPAAHEHHWIVLNLPVAWPAAPSDEPSSDRSPKLRRNRLEERPGGGPGMLVCCAGRAITLERTTMIGPPAPAMYVLNATLADLKGETLYRKNGDAVLRHLIDNVNRLVTKAEPIECVWGTAFADTTGPGRGAPRRAGDMQAGRRAGRQTAG